jgi:hypothetical protein
MTKYHDDKCIVTCENNGKAVDAEVLEFKENVLLNVSLDRQVKIKLTWNGNIYEGRGFGMSFTSKGPKIITTKEGRNA